MVFLFRNNLTPCTCMLSLGLSYLCPYNTFTKCAILLSTCIFLKSSLNIYDLLSEFSSVQENPAASHTICHSTGNQCLWWKGYLWTRVTWQVTKSVLWFHRNLENALGGEQVTKNLNTPPLNDNSKMRCHGINFYGNIFKPFHTNFKKSFLAKPMGTDQ